MDETWKEKRKHHNIKFTAMSEFFGRNRVDFLEEQKRREFNNFIDFSYYDAIKKGNHPKSKKVHYPLNADGYNNCCMAATGDVPEPEKNVSDKVVSMKPWGYVKTGLALVGAYVVAKWIIAKLK